MLDTLAQSQNRQRSVRICPPPGSHRASHASSSARQSDVAFLCFIPLWAFQMPLRCRRWTAGVDDTEQAVPWARCGFLSLFPTSTIVLVLSCNSENINHDGTRLAFAVLDNRKSLLPLEHLRLRWLMLTSTHGTSIPKVVAR